jgi:hypothetical protein
MLIENERNKAKADHDRMRERENDVQTQEEHMRIMAKKEEDCKREFKAREKRA